jgi:hypothetical protein
VEGEIVSDDDEDYSEPIGSCDNCGVNIYEDDREWGGLCDSCAWFAAGCPEPGRSEE